MDINQHVLQGRLCDDPQIINTVNGSITRLRLATNRFYTDRMTGEKRQRSSYHTVLVPDFLSDQVASARKGDTIFVSGFAEDYEYTDSKSQRRTVRQLVAENISMPFSPRVASARRVTSHGQESSRPRQAPAPAPAPAPRYEDRPARREQPVERPARNAPPRERGGYLHDPQSPAYENPRDQRHVPAASSGRSRDFDAPDLDAFAELDRHLETFGGPNG